MRLVVRHPYTKFEVRSFVGLAIRKIWRTMCVSINGPGDLDLWPFAVASKVGNLHSEFGHARPSGSRVIRYVRDRQKQRFCYAPFPTGGA